VKKTTGVKNTIFRRTIYMSIYESDFQNQSGKQDLFNEEQDWKKRSDELAAWAMKRMVNRNDIFGRYYTKGDQRRSCKEDGVVDTSRIAIHFATNDRDKIIGLYSTSLEDTGLWLTIDFDRHDGDAEVTGPQNFKLASSAHDQLVDIGFHPLLIDSNGNGGLHLSVFFDKPIPAKLLRAFGLWLVRDWKAAGVVKKPEVFPKQDSIQGKVGNFVRLFGLHHTRKHRSKVWDGSQWQAGSRAIERILAIDGDSQELIPNNIFETSVSPTHPEVGSIQNENEEEQWLRIYKTDLRSLDLVGLLESGGYDVNHVAERKYRVECPWKDQHTSGDDSASILIADQGDKLTPTFNCFHDHCRNRSLKDVLKLFNVEVVESFCEQPFGSVGRLLKSAKTPENKAFFNGGKHLGLFRTSPDFRFRVSDSCSVSGESGTYLRNPQIA